MSVAHKGLLVGSKNPMYGVHKFGKNSPNWKGGITPLIRHIRFCGKYKEWKK